MTDINNIYTLGTSLRSEENFAEILYHYQIKAFLDVRSFPRSKLPLFNKENLEKLTGEMGIQYYYFGKELGGFRRGSYVGYMETGAFKRGIDRIEEIAKEKNSVIVCAERFPWKCHRRFIASVLKQRGWHIIHIIDLHQTWIARQ